MRSIQVIQTMHPLSAGDNSAGQLGNGEILALDELNRNQTKHFFNLTRVLAPYARPPPIDGTDETSGARSPGARIGIIVGAAVAGRI